MKAMVLTSIGPISERSAPLVAMDVPEPVPGHGELLVRVSACGVCHTELDEIEGRTPPSSLPRILGHQVVGRVEQIGPKSEVPPTLATPHTRATARRAGASGEGGRSPKSNLAEPSAHVAAGQIAASFAPGDRVGVGWIYSACGTCAYCANGLENLCPDFRATGRDADGGYAEFMVVPAAFAHRIPDVFSDAEAAPLLCAGAIGYRSLEAAGLRDGDALGLTGFGASAHLVLKMARHRFPASRVHVFTRSADERAFAMELGASWAGDIPDRAPESLAAIIDTTPAWKPIVEALANLRPGGRLVVNAIRKEERDKEALLALDYATHLWREKQVVSVANVTRRDVRECLALAAQIPIRPEVERYPLADANRALLDIRQRRIRGGKVLMID